MTFILQSWRPTPRLDTRVLLVRIFYDYLLLRQIKNLIVYCVHRINASLTRYFEMNKRRGYILLIHFLEG